VRGLIQCHDENHTAANARPPPDLSQTAKEIHLADFLLSLQTLGRLVRQASTLIAA